jgi:hypothetical protein
MVDIHYHMIIIVKLMLNMIKNHSKNINMIIIVKLMLNMIKNHSKNINKES